MKTQTLRFLLPIALAFSLLAPSTIAHAASFVVTKTADTADGTCDADCSLREAIIAANATAGDDTITVPAGTYTLTIAGTGENAAATGDLDIKSNITINGAGAGTTIIDGGALDRVFEVFRAFTVNISGVTVRNGNLTGDDGGGIFNNAGTLTITNSTFSGNSTIYEGGGFGGAGGGVYTYGGTASITNSTFSGNSAVVTGGGILGNGASTLTITNSTFSGNSAADGYGGGLRISGGTATLHNTIVANNTGGNCSAIPITDGGNNLDSANTCGFTINAKINTDPNLGALTGSPAYFPLNPGSPAIDAGNDTVCSAQPVSNTSQNGLTRPQGPHCDIGSYEAADTTPPTVVSVTRADANPTSAATVHFTVTFSEAVTGVDLVGPPFDDFTLTPTGVTGASVTGVSGSGSTYTVTVTTGSGIGTLRLDVVDNHTILDLSLNPLGGPLAGDGNFTHGEVYSVRFYSFYLPLMLR